MRDRPVVSAPTDATAREFLCWLLRDEPRVETLDENRVRVHSYVEGETYWRVSGTDLYALLEARRFILARREARDDGRPSVGAGT